MFHHFANPEGKRVSVNVNDIAAVFYGDATRAEHNYEQNYLRKLDTN